MEVSRKPFIVNYFKNNVLKKLRNLDGNLVYVSRRFKYAIIYLDADKGEAYLKKELNKTRGLINISPSLIYDENLNI